MHDIPKSADDAPTPTALTQLLTRRREHGHDPTRLFEQHVVNNPDVSDDVAEMVAESELQAFNTHPDFNTSGENGYVTFLRDYLGR